MKQAANLNFEIGIYSARPPTIKTSPTDFRAPIEQLPDGALQGRNLGSGSDR